LAVKRTMPGTRPTFMSALIRYSLLLCTLSGSHGAGPSPVRWPFSSDPEGDSCGQGDGGRCYSSLVQMRARATPRAPQGSADDGGGGFGDAGRGRVGVGEGAAATRRALKIYVYDLPATMLHNGTLVVLRQSCKEYPPNMSCGPLAKLGTNAVWGGPIELSGGLEVHQVYQFALGSIFFVSLMGHPQRTLDPTEADLFFVPAFMDPNGLQTYDMHDNCPSAELLVAQLPHLNDDSASRHIWLAPSVGWVNETCDAFQANSSSTSPAALLLAKTIKLALEDRESAPHSLAADRELAVDENAPMSMPWADNLHSIPYPSVLSGFDAARVAAWQASIAVPTQRPYLVSGVWGAHGLGSSMDIRTSMQRQCLASPECSFIDLNGMRGRTNTEDVMEVGLVSTFCLEPPGDTPSRKGMVDSIVAGCIPVLFSPLQTKLWPWHIGDWRDVSVLASPTCADIVAFLSDIPHAEVERMQQNLVPVVRRLTYSPLGYPDPDDALETTLRAVLAIALAS